MKLYTVYNGFMGHGPIQVTVVAEDEVRAYELASDEYKRDSMRIDGKHMYPERYWTNLEVVLEFDPEQDTTEEVREVRDS